jgi:hypothetical protein
MKQADRFRAAQRVAGWHLLVSLVVLAACVALIYGAWYPQPFDHLLGVSRIVAVMVVVDAICGPLLTLLLFNPAKARWKWRIDMALIAAIQLSALAYGMDLIHGGRPLFLALEGDRFRLVQQGHVLSGSPVQWHVPTIFGGSPPQPLGVRLLGPDDPGYAESVQQAAAGLHPAYRPDRWVPYSEQIAVAQNAMRPIEELRLRGSPEATLELEGLIRRAGLQQADVGYLPLVSDFPVDWSVVLNKADARILGIVSISGWSP